MEQQPALLARVGLLGFVVAVWFDVRVGGPWLPGLSHWTVDLWTTLMQHAIVESLLTNLLQIQVANKEGF